VTDTLDRQIKIGKYEIILISKSRFEKSVIKSLYLSSLINEAKAILNEDLLMHYKIQSKKILIKKNLEEIKSIVKINEKSINIDKEMGQNVSDETLYSIILRFRELYLIECLKYGKNPSTKEFINLIKKISSEESYNAYLRTKNDLKTKKIISVKEAKALIDAIKINIKRLENGKKN